MVTRKRELASVLEQYSLEEIKGKLESWNSEIDYLLKYSFKDFLILSQSLKDYYSELKNYFKESSSKINDKTEQQNLLNNINQLIIELQFHDIIRQKLEHIHQIQEETVMEIKSIPVQSDFSKTNFIYIIPEISLLNKNQLDHLSDEYANATTGIRESLDSIIKIIKENKLIGLDVEETEKHANEFNKVVELLTEDLNSLNVTFLKKGDMDVTSQSLEKLKQIEKLYTMKSERIVFNSLFCEELEAEDEDLDIELF